MPRRKTQSNNPFDLLAFQDVITSTTGIMLVFTLLLILTIGADRMITAAAEKQAIALKETLLNTQHAELSAELAQRQTLSTQLDEKQALLKGYLQAEVLEYAPSSPQPTAVSKIRTVIPPVSPENLKPLLIEAKNNTLYIHWEGKEIPVPIHSNGGPRLSFVYNFLKPFWKDPSVAVALPHINPEHKPVPNAADAIIILMKPSAFDIPLSSLPAFIPHTIDIIPEDWEVTL